MLDAARSAAWEMDLKAALMCRFQTDIGAGGTNVPIREKAHSGVSPAGAAKGAAWGIEMKIYSIHDPEFREYGHVVIGYEDLTSAIAQAMTESTPCPEEGTGYVPEEPALQKLEAAKKLALSLFGGLPVQFGWCNGHNTKLNCLEYHRSSEFNLGTEDFILLLAKQSELTDWSLDSTAVRAFRVPAGTLIEVYATTMHYAPCQASKDKGFRVLVALPEGTNTEMPQTEGKSSEDRLLFARNKWLIAHADAPEAGKGAFVGIRGENIDIAGEI